MAKIWEPYRGYTRCRHYTDLITRSCFRSIRIEGRERIPAEGAVILAPNHCATLLDPMLQLLLRPDKAPIAFGARSDIFANPRTAKILRWLRIVPIARERNGLNEVAKNFEVFDEIVDCLDHDVPFCMYAEGTHRAERGMLPVKKGLFRVAKMASDHLGKPVYIFPIGTCYEDFFRGQTRVRMRVGEPMEIGAEFARRADLPEAEVRLVPTDRVRLERRKHRGGARHKKGIPAGAVPPKLEKKDEAAKKKKRRGHRGGRRRSAKKRAQTEALLEAEAEYSEQA